MHSAAQHERGCSAGLRPAPAEAEATAKADYPWDGRTVGAMDGAHRAPTDEGALLAKHCFASARTHSRWRLCRTPEGGFTACPASPHRPAKPAENQSRFGFGFGFGFGRCPGFKQVQGAALPTHPPLRTKTISLFSANRHPFATPVPYCAAACAHGRPMLKNARPSLRSIQDDIAMAGSWGSGNRTYQATRTVQLPLHGDSDNVTSN